MRFAFDYSVRARQLTRPIAQALQLGTDHRTTSVATSATPRSTTRRGRAGVALDNATPMVSRWPWWTTCSGIRRHSNHTPRRRTRLTACRRLRRRASRAPTPGGVEPRALLRRRRRSPPWAGVAHGRRGRLLRRVSAVAAAPTPRRRRRRLRLLSPGMCSSFYDLIAADEALRARPAADVEHRLLLLAPPL